MGEIVDLDTYRAAQKRRQREDAKRKERGKFQAERGDSSSIKPNTEPLEDDPA